MSEKYDISKYPEGLEILAEKLDLPFPLEEMQKRKDYVLAFIDGMIRL